MLINPKPNELWSCSDDGAIIIWSLKERKQIDKLDINSGSIKCMEVVNSSVWSGGTNNAITCWSINVSIENNNNNNNHKNLIFFF